jgi:hypothetical protein
MTSSLALRAAALVAAVATAAAATSGTVYYTAGQYSFKPNVVDPVAGVAWGSYARWTESVGAFGSLSVSTNGQYEDSQQMFAAGVLEGSLTQADIFDQHQNVYAWLLSQFPGRTSLPPQFVDFFAQQDAWARSQVAANKTSPLWQGTGLVLNQFDGLVAGYNATAPGAQNLTVFQLQTLNAIGDALDLIPALTPEYAPDWDNMTPAEVIKNFRSRNHCSGLVKITGNYSDIFFGHSAWFIFQSTLRIYKHYNFALNLPNVVGRQMSFSSYPCVRGGQGGGGGSSALLRPG